jgi:hypothetical protein
MRSPVRAIALPDLCAVRWYLRYSLSLRDVEELLEERGLNVDHTTVAAVTLPGRNTAAHRYCSASSLKLRKPITGR